MVKSFNHDRSFENFGSVLGLIHSFSSCSFLAPVFLGDSVLNGILGKSRYGLKYLMIPTITLRLINFMKSIPVSLAKKFAGQYLLGFSFLIEYTDFVKDKTSLL